MFLALVAGLYVLIPSSVMPSPTAAPRESYELARVLETKDEAFTDEQFGNAVSQTVKVEITTGGDKGKTIDLQNGEPFTVGADQKVVKGDLVIVNRVEQGSGTTFYVVDKYRLRSLILLALVFVFAVIVFAGIKGVGSVLGFVTTLLFLGAFVVPRLVSGQNAIWISFLGACMIATVSMFLSHGFGYRTRIAYISTLILLVLSVVLSQIAVGMSHLSGMGSEDAFFLQAGFNLNINIKGILLAGIIIGVLGVLDDVTTAQVATVDEIHKANPKLGLKELYERGTSVGKEHIASLVNTLVLAYAGSSLPLFLLFTLNKQQPAWLLLNSEFLAEEIVRTLVGSLVLVLAVPVSTWLSAFYCSRKKPGTKSTKI